MSLTEEKVHTVMILEMLGRPPEHLKETLEEYIKKMGEEKGVKVSGYKINEPKELEENKSLFTTFAEIDLETDSVKEIVSMIFKYMPAHIEIVSPENLSIKNNFLNETMNELARRLHAYDQVARVLTNEKEILEKKVKDLAGEKEEESSK